MKSADIRCLQFLLPGVLALAGSLPAAGDTLCATPDQAAAVQALYSTGPMPPTFMAAGKLGLNEGVVASALPAGRGIGVPASEFGKVWESLQSWGDALILVIKGPNILEIHSRVPPGKPSDKSPFYNLTPGMAFSGHLRPDLWSAIYAVNLEGAEGPLRGLTFLDQTGDGVLGVYVPAERGKPAPALLAQFEQTWELMRRLPRACAP